MYIATHLGWVVLSCAVLMFFRKRSIQKTNKKKSKVSGILPSPAQPAAPSPHGRAPLGMHQAWQRGRVSAELGGALFWGITQSLPKHWFWCTQIQNFPLFSCGWVPQVIPQPLPVPGFWISRPVLGKGRARPAQSRSVLHP